MLHLLQVSLFGRHPIFAQWKISILESLKTTIPEVRELCEWNEISDYKKGEIIGGLVGKYGLDIFLTAGSLKGIKVIHELRRANAIMTLETMTSLEKAKTLEAISGKWNTNVVKELENINSGALRKDKELYRRYRDQVLNETQVRKILHEAGYETFQKPKNIPSNWHVEISKSQGGMRYSDPTNKHNYIRVMSGNPESPFPAQRKPYVKHNTPKGCLDKNGQIVSEKDPSAHIPLEEYNFDLFVEKKL